MLNRRDLLKLPLCASAASVVVVESSASAGQPEGEWQIIDSNVNLFRWPNRRLPLDETEKLVARFSSLNVVQAWVSSLEGLLHRDIVGVNQRLADDCRKSERLLPIGCLNLTLPGWEHDLEQCLTLHKMPGVRLWPGVHGYDLAQPAFRQLLNRCAASGLLVQIAASLEDSRTQHSLLQVPDTDLAPLTALVPDLNQEVRIQILNHRLRPSQAAELGALPGIYFDTARVDATNGVPRLVNSVPQGRVLHGSHAPFLIPEAALIRVHESGQLPQAEVRAVLFDNANRLLKKAV